MHSGQPLGEGAREGQVEDEHRTGGPRWVRGRGRGGGPGAEEPTQESGTERWGCGAGEAGPRPQDRRGRVDVILGETALKAQAAGLVGGTSGRP